MYTVLAVLVILLGIFFVALNTKNRTINIIAAIGGVLLIIMGIAAIFGII